MKHLIHEFKDPSESYRGKPFWSWNGRLEEKELERQMDVLQDMGMGGYFCHSRTGLATEYLGEEWFSLINACAAKGQKSGMETWLYDEDRWPSGTAGGIVTKNPAYRIHYLRLNVVPAEQFAFSGDVIAAFTVKLEGQNFTDKQRIFGPVTPAQGSTVLYFTSEEMVEYSFYNGETYVDTMNPEATAEFLRTTHEQYMQHCGENILNGNIKGIFTDEPHHGGIMCGFALQNKEGSNLTPYPKDLFRHFEARFGYDLTDYLPELYLFKDGEMVSQVKWHYSELLCELFINNYLVPCQTWCAENGLLFTGHLLHEDCLGAQAAVNGSMQRGYEYMDIPGVDVLWEHNYNYHIVKQLQSSARQFGKEELLSELYGCTGWQMTFQDHKAVGDWQSLYGISMRCHHLSWYTMKGEAKRDYPASIFYQSEWYKEYKYVEDYYSRLNVVREGGNPVCDTLIMSPVESLWATVHPGWGGFWGVTDPETQKVEKDYIQLYNLLQGGHVDFDYGDEEQMARLCRCEKDEQGAVLVLGTASYRTLIIPTCLTIRRTTLEIARSFAELGGKVIFLCTPEYVDALPSQEAATLPVTYTNLGPGLLGLLDKNSYIRVSAPEVALQTIVHDDRIVFMLMNLDRENTIKDVTISLRKGGYVEQWDVRTGDISLIANGESPSITMDFAPCQELILVLRDHSDAPCLPKTQIVEQQTLSGTFEYSLTEPNIVVIDSAAYSLRGEEYNPSCDILKADRQIRDRLGITYRNGEMLQPWYKEKVGIAEDDISSPLALRYEFEIETLCDITLMLELQNYSIRVNDVPLEAAPLKEWFIDPCFSLIPITNGLLHTGRNTITLECEFRDAVDIEAIYLLGKFGVRLDGLVSTLTDLPAKLTIGDIAAQGLPFYSGAIDYHLPSIDAKDCQVFLSTSFEGVCVTVHGDQQKATMAFAPYCTDITQVASDSTFVRLHLSRRNTFGPMHINPAEVASYGPDSFLTEGNDFLYDAFSLVPNGLTSPICLEYRK